MQWQNERKERQALKMKREEAEAPLSLPLLPTMSLLMVVVQAAMMRENTHTQTVGQPERGASRKGACHC